MIDLIMCEDDVFELPYCSFRPSQLIAMFDAYLTPQALKDEIHLKDKITISLCMSRYLEKERVK